ncbi:ABC transporter permease [Pseudonocardia sp. H11422]|uniref:ABC transporter permease n=1 Tax=Pseudonocardia sp. H11422 TaxID=2835866 RepID=UPI001BDC30D6|nr:ABC transporter permease [Pseudonocardia sp. H11422]
MTVPVTDTPVPASAARPVQAPKSASSRGRLVFRRFLRNKMGLAGGIVLVLLFAGAFVSPLFYPFDHRQQDDLFLLTPPSPTHWFGTSKLGEDLFAQTMRGLQKSLIIGLLVAVLSTGLAAIVGASAGYFGNAADRSLMWVVDLLLVLPSFLVVAILSPLFRGESWLLLVLLLGLFSWMITARIVRGMTLSLREREFVKAARFMGMPPWRIILKHLLPNMASLLIIDATITVGAAILAETSLSFFGFGIQPPDVSLGTLIASGTESALTFPWLFGFPAGLLVLTVLAVNFLGDGLRDALDPTSSRGRRRG